MDPDNRQNMRLVLAARLSRKVGQNQGIGIDTQDEYGRAWAEAQGHTVIDTAADYKSGRVPPWDRPHLRPWVTRPDLMAKYDGILAYKNDRLSRGAWEDEVRIRQWASENGKVLVIVDGPQWPPRDDGDFWSWTAQAKQAEKEWLEIQERILRFQGRLRADRKLVGVAPFGFDIAGERYNKTLVPNTIGQRYIPGMFQRVADGESLAQVALWLNSAGVAGKLGKAWSNATVAQIIHNRIYMGQRVNAAGLVELEVEPLVDARLWKRANDRLANAPVGRRKPTTGQPALLTGVLFCARCGAPMYRIRSTPHKRNPNNIHYLYYRCAGAYPQRKGCGNIIDLAVTDRFVPQLLGLSSEPWKEPQLVAGENHDIELAEIELRLQDLPKRKLPDAEEDAERTRLRDERDRLESLPNIPDGWEYVEICGTCDGSKYLDACETADHHKVTVGEHFNSLDFAGQRKMLLENVKVYAENPRDPVIREIIGSPLVRIESRLFRVPLELIQP